MKAHQVLVGGSLLAVLAAGCHRETQEERFAREFRESQVSRVAAAKLQTALYQHLSNTQMIALNTKDGLGLAIRPDKLDLHVGEPLKLHLAYENISARGSISATTCQGWSISDEDVLTGLATAGAMRFSCSNDDLLRDDPRLLNRGDLKTAEVSTTDARITFDHPGKYIIMASWQSFRPRDGLFQIGDDYSLLGSNPVLITVH